jgi:UDP-glucuronate 4-epimerase
MKDAGDAVLVTGAAGFIGMHLAAALLGEGRRVIGVDDLNGYYSPELKRARLAALAPRAGFEFRELDLADAAATAELFATVRPTTVLHMAAQPGVRYSLENPAAYIRSNLAAFGNVLEGCRHRNAAHLIYASSSSVYGANRKLPYSVKDNVDHPISLYAATKKADELMAHTYAHLFDLPVTGLRFFTVYGPWGRPDMAYYKFTRAIFEGRPIDVYNNGDMRRDFTYIDDIVDGALRVMAHPPKGNPDWNERSPDPSTSKAPYRVYNIGNNRPVELARFIEVLEDAIGRKAIRNHLPLQPGDVLETYADIDDLVRDTGFAPKTPIEQGLPRFVDWYRTFHRV